MPESRTNLNLSSMKSETIPVHSYFKFLLILLAVFITVVAFVFHSGINSPSVYENTSCRACTAMDLFIDGLKAAEGIEGTVSIRLEPGQEARLEGRVTHMAEGKTVYILPTNAPYYEFYADGTLIGRTRPEYETVLTHSEEFLHTGKLEEDISGKTMTLVLRNNTQAAVTLSAGCPFLYTQADLIAFFRSPLLIFFTLAVIHATILIIAVLGLVFALMKKTKIRLGYVLLSELLLIVLTLVSCPLRMLMISDEVLWVLLERIFTALLPVTALALIIKGEHLTKYNRPFCWLIAMVPMCGLILTAAAAPFCAALAHFFFHYMRLASTLALLALALVFIITGAARESEDNFYAKITFLLILTVSLVLEDISTMDLRLYSNFRCVSNILRLTGFICYSAFALYDYIQRENINLRNVELDDLLFKDSLTDCLNRRSFDQFCRQEENLTGKEYLAVSIDINEIKLVNDCFGHAQGDRVFSSFGRFMKANLSRDALIWRTGGDEFVCLVPLSQAAETDFAALEEEWEKEAPYSSSFSYGTAEYRGGGPEAFSECLRQADKAMYDMKRQRTSSRERLKKGGRL